MKAIIIDEPWITLILSGQKTWEMRKTPNHDRGLIGLIRKGSGQVVGTANMMESLPALSPEQYLNTEHLHRISHDRQAWAISEEYLIPWVLGGTRPLARPVPYHHKPGAQSRIILDEATTHAVLEQVPDGLVEETKSAATSTPQVTQVPKAPASRGSSRGWIDGNTAYTVLTSGNVNNGHFYLGPILEFFPNDAVGGNDRSQLAKLLLTVDYQGVGSSRTDITGPDRLGRPGTSNHCFFRERGPIRQFFKRTAAKDKDIVAIEQVGENDFRISLRKGVES